MSNRFAAGAVLSALVLSSHLAAAAGSKPAPRSVTVQHGQADVNNLLRRRGDKPIRYKVTFKKYDVGDYRLSKAARKTLVREYLTKHPEVVAFYGKVKWDIEIKGDHFTAQRVGAAPPPETWKHGREMHGYVAMRTGSRPGSRTNGSNLVFRTYRLPTSP